MARLERERQPLDEWTTRTGAYAPAVTEPNPTTRDAGPWGRCVCGEKVTIADAREITLSNGRAGSQGYCPACRPPRFAIRRGSRATGASPSRTGCRGW
jgi:hypothetical protein